MVGLAGEQQALAQQLHPAGQIITGYVDQCTGVEGVRVPADIVALRQQLARL
jgi:hypothetical protein